jgi:uncharacterized membrane protein
MFEQLGDFTIPLWHPVVVHFPVALSITAVLAAALWLARNKLRWWRMTLILQVGALAGAIAALRTGEAMEEQSEGMAMVDQFVELHETMGERAAWALGLSILLLIGMRWAGLRETAYAGVRLRWRLIAFVVVLLAALLVGLTGHIGGLMTWGVPV